MSFGFPPSFHKVIRNKGKSLLELPDNYVIIDIETTGLSPQYDAIIELSALKCINDKIIERYSTLVKPVFQIDDYITDLTGITNEMLADAPSIEDVIDTYVDFIGNDIIIGHNVNFDINFIYDNYNEIAGKELHNDYVDLLRISRRLFPDFTSHKLSVLSEEFNIDHLPTHRGYDDCTATYECYLYCKNYITNNNIDFKPTYKTLDLRTISAEGSSFDTSNLLYGKVCVFTGKLEKLTRAEAAQLVVNIGGVCENGVTARTNFLILGNNDYCKSIKDGKSSKHKKAEKLILSGQDLQILTENVFYDFILDGSNSIFNNAVQTRKPKKHRKTKAEYAKEYDEPFEYDEIDENIYKCFIYGHSGLSESIGTWEQFHIIENKIAEKCAENKGRYYKTEAKSARFAIVFDPYKRTQSEKDKLNAKGYKVTSFENALKFFNIDDMWDIDAMSRRITEIKEYWVL